MDTTEAVRAMLDETGASPYAAAMALGKTHSYISGMLRRGSEPAPSVLADIAHVCGRELVLVPEGSDVPEGTIVIDGRLDWTADED